MTTIQNNNIINNKKKRELWPGRYTVVAKVEEMPHRGNKYKDVWLMLFREEMSEEEVKALLEPLGVTPKVEMYQYLVSQAEETFTEQQADELIAYLETYNGTKATKKPAKKPENGYMGVGAIAVGGGQEFYMLSTEPHYNLSFKAWAYYDVRMCE